MRVLFLPRELFEFQSVIGFEFLPNYPMLLGKLLRSKSAAAPAWERPAPKHGRYPTLSIAFFQTVIAHTKVFAVCPYTLQAVEARCGKLLESNDANAALFCYRFYNADGNVFWLIFGGVFQSLTAIFMVKHSVIGVFNDQIKLGRNVLSMIARLEDQVLQESTGPDSKVVYVTGIVKNFGHNIWNDLSGLDLLKSQGKLSEKILLGPYFPLEEGDPAFDFNETDRFSRLYELVTYVNSNNVLPVRPVDFILEPSLVQGLKGSARNSSHRVFYKQRLDGSYPVLWISIEAGNKWGTWEDEVDGLAYVINEIYRRHPTLAVIFDGWTKLLGDYSDPDLRAIELVERKISYIDQLLPAALPRVNLNGETFANKLAVAYISTLYICRFGSPLTIPSWLADLPGVSYGPNELLSRDWAYLYRSDFHCGMTNSTLTMPKSKVCGSGARYTIDIEWVVKEIDRLISQVR